MAVVQFGGTGPDGSFTAAGISAWIRVLQADQSVSPPPRWTFPDQDATILYQGAAASLQSLTLSGLNVGSPSLVGPRILWASDAGAVSAFENILYNPAATAGNSNGGTNARIALTGVGFESQAVFTDPELRVTGNYFGHTLSPSSDQGAGGGSAVKIQPIIKATGGTFKDWTGLDLFGRIDETTTKNGLTFVGGSFAVMNEAPIALTYLTGAIASVIQAHDNASSAEMTALMISGNSFIFQQKGRTGAYRGLYIRDLDITGSPSLIADHRAAIEIATMLGSPGGGSPTPTDYAIYSRATQPSFLTGSVGIGITPTAKLDVQQNSGWGSFTPSYAGAIAADTVALIRETITSVPTNLSNAALTANVDVEFAGSPTPAPFFFPTSGNFTATITTSDVSTWNSNSALYGINAQASYEGRGSMPTVVGLKSIANRRRDAGNLTGYMSAGEFGITTGQSGTAGGTVTLADTIRALRPTGAAGMTFTDINGVHILNQTPSAGTLTNPSRGLKIDSQTGVGAVAIEQLGTDDYNIFMGPIKLGGTADRGGSPNQTSTNSIDVFNTTAAPIGTLAGATIYASGGKLFAMDGNGVATQLTP